MTQGVRFSKFRALGQLSSAAPCSRIRCSRTEASFDHRDNLLRYHIATTICRGLPGETVLKRLASGRQWRIAGPRAAGTPGAADLG